MSRVTAIVLALVGASTIGITVVSTALAEPELSPTTKQKITDRLGTNTLSDAAGASITCSQGTGSSEVTGPRSTGVLVVTFTGCTGKETESESPCTVKGAGAKNSGEIVTNTLKTLLGLVATSEATSGIGLLLEPAAGHTWFTVAKATCTTEGALEGTLAGEVTSLIEEGKTLEIGFLGKTGSQRIKKITVPPGEEKPSLKAFGVVNTSDEGAEALTFEKTVKLSGLKAVPRITVNPTNKTFMNLVVANNERETQTVTYTNNGPGAWTIGVQSILAQEHPGLIPGFSLLAANNTCFNKVVPEAAPNNKCSVEIEFKPPAVGSYTGAFKIVPYSPFMTLIGEGI
jgi:hypothetical protein